MCLKTLNCIIFRRARIYDKTTFLLRKHNFFNSILNMAEEKHDESFILKPIGHASTWFRVKNATPRQPSVSALTRGSITVSKEIFANPEHSLENLSEFSHVWIIFVFHKNSGPCIKAKVAPPRLNGARVGLFSTRTPHRPNPIGLSLAKVEKVEGDTLHVCGIDLLDGTPILDIKPYIPSYDSPQVEKTDDSSTDDHPAPTTVLSPDWITLGGQSVLTVTFTEAALAQIRLFSSEATDPNYRLAYLRSPEEALKAIEDILREDPRSIYRKKKCSELLYFCEVDAMHVTSWFDEVSNKCEVVRVMPFTIRKALNEANQKEQPNDNLPMSEDKM